MTTFDENGIAVVGNGNGHEPPEMPRVLIGIPSQDTWKAQFGYSLALMRLNAVATIPDCEVSIVLHRSTLIADQRQYLAQEALDQGATHLLYLDTDMTFPPETLHRLLSCNVDIVGANYVCRRHPVKPTAVTMDENGRLRDLYTEPDSKGLQEVVWMGMGIMLVKTNVFRALAKPWFHLMYHEHNGRFSGEDVWFCRHAHASGFHIFVDQELSNHRDEQGRYTVTHIGDHEYTHGESLTLRESLHRPGLIVGHESRNVRGLTVVP